MDWKEALKWIGVLVAAGMIGTVLELVIEAKLTGPAAVNTARAEARAEVDRIMAQALTQANKQTAGVVVQKREPVYVQPQKEVGYAYQM
jgi:hypothetical protein